MSFAARIGLVVALAGWLLIGVGVWLAWPVVVQLADPGRPRTFYVPSQSMMPTIEVDDRVRPVVETERELVPGKVVVFEGPDTVRIARIVATGGRTVSLRGGRVTVDGRAALLRDLGPGPPQDGSPTRLHRERLPGEQGTHRVLDAGPGPGDEFGPIRVPPGSLFVLGDNRDRAADSRFPPAIGGVGIVSVGQVIGVVDRLLWRSGFRELGRPIDASTGR